MRCTLAADHIPVAARQDAFGEMYRVPRPGGALLVAGFRIEACGDLALLRYVRAIGPGAS